MTKDVNSQNCFLCRVMRGLAFGGMGAAIGGYGALWLGMNQTNAIISALFGALFVTTLFNRPKKQ